MKTKGGHTMTAATLPAQTIMLRAIQERDVSFDGIFFSAVKTTGIFCRPSCRSKTPLVKNILFFATISEAIAAGFRACKRCKPELITNRQPEWVLPLLQRLEREPSRVITDSDLLAMNISPSRARSYFKCEYGMTFHEYERSLRIGMAHTKLRRQSDLDDVALSSGYQSHSGFRDGYKRVIGGPPGRSREKVSVVSKLIETPLGKMRLAATEHGLCLAEFADDIRVNEEISALKHYLDCAVVPGTNRHIVSTERQLHEYFEGKRTEFELSLVTPGTEFEQKVWRALREISYGETISYLDLAVRIGDPKAVRAVGSANGRNRIPIIVPCHRVVNHNGQLGGYGGGLWRKKRLLELEQQVKHSETGRPLQSEFILHTS